MRLFLFSMWINETLLFLSISLCGSKRFHSAYFAKVKFDDYYSVFIFIYRKKNLISKSDSK